MHEPHNSHALTCYIVQLDLFLSSLVCTSFLLCTFIKSVFLSLSLSRTLSPKFLLSFFVAIFIHSFSSYHVHFSQFQKHAHWLMYTIYTPCTLSDSRLSRTLSVATWGEEEAVSVGERKSKTCHNLKDMTGGLRKRATPRVMEWTEHRILVNGRPAIQYS